MKQSTANALAPLEFILRVATGLILLVLVGQFLFAPFGVALIDNAGWQNALLVFGGLLLFIVPMALALATPRSEPKPAGAGVDVAATQSFSVMTWYPFS